MSGKRYAVLITTDGEQINKTPKNGTDFSLEELQEFVGGYIEIVSLGGALIMVVNDEGKPLDLPLNKTATKEYWFYTKNYSDYIVGNVLMCESCLVR
jgi:hypothetical protein